MIGRLFARLFRRGLMLPTELLEAYRRDLDALRIANEELRGDIARLEAERLGASIGAEALSAFDRLGVLRALYPAGPAVAGGQARPWRKVLAQSPELIEDLARIGGLYAQRPRSFDPTGAAIPEPVDPYQLAIDQGRREAVLEILAHNLSMTELNALLEDRDV